MDITLDDLLVMEPRLILPVGAEAATTAPWRIETVAVTWAVTARTTPPHLPVLRGGEVLLVPAKVATELGADLPALLREAELRNVSVGVLDRSVYVNLNDGPEVGRIPLLVWAGDLVADTETIFNRRLTECRGDLYRIGSDLERQMADLTLSRAGVAALVRVASHASGLPITIEDASGRRLASSVDQMPRSMSRDSKVQTYEIRRDLVSRASLTLGPLQPEQRVIGRFLVARIAAMVGVAMQRDDAARPRGQRRVEATEALLAGRRTSSSDQRAAALELGLDPDAVFFVAVSNGESDSTLARALAPLGAIHPAGGTNGRRSMLIATNARAAATSLASRVADIKRRWESDHETDGATLALSAPALGVASLPAAAREAQFVATLQAQAELPKRAASFESVDDVGALRLLYHLRNSNELRSFVSEALGTLENRDSRGTLRATLRAFLESGGSQVDASHKLGIHRNTLAYRLRRIGELVGRDVADPGSWLTLHLALRASEMLDVCAEDG